MGVITVFHSQGVGQPVIMERRNAMKSLELMQLSPEGHWCTVATYTTNEDMCWAIEFAAIYPDEFRVKVGR